MWEFSLNLKGNKDVVIDKKVSPPILFKMVQQGFCNQENWCKTVTDNYSAKQNRSKEESQFVYKVRDVTIL